MKNKLPGLETLIIATTVLVLGTATANAQFLPNIVEYDEAEVLFEENTTDGDLGFHLFVDGEAWNRVFLFNPKGKIVVNASVSANLKDIGLTELFSESAEPGYDELPRADFLSKFGKGTYVFVGISLEGDILVGEAQLTKDIPAGPVITSPVEDAEIDPTLDLLVAWDLVADPKPPKSVIEYYEVVVEKDEDDERLRVFRVDVLAEETSITVPAEFFEEGKDYKVEIVVGETSGNRATSEVPFSTLEDE